MRERTVHHGAAVQDDVRHWLLRRRFPELWSRPPVLDEALREPLRRHVLRRPLPELRCRSAVLDEAVRDPLRRHLLRRRCSALRRRHLPTRLARRGRLPDQPPTGQLRPHHLHIRQRHTPVPRRWDDPVPGTGAVQGGHHLRSRPVARRDGGHAGLFTRCGDVLRLRRFRVYHDGHGYLRRGQCDADDHRAASVRGVRTGVRENRLVRADTPTSSLKVCAPRWVFLWTVESAGDRGRNR